jgi:hypothetical protein
LIFYYLDSNAWVKRYYYEIGTIWVQELFANEKNIICSSLGLIEVISVLARKWKAGTINLSTLEKKIQDIENDWKHFIQEDLSTEVIEVAKRLSKELALRGADAIHLASALVAQRNFAEEDDQLILVTSDIEMKNAAEASNLMVIDPNKQEI